MERYNNLCETCHKDCKQLKMAVVIECPHYSHNGKRYVDKSAKRNIATREMGNQERFAINKLVWQCANFDKENKQCLPLDCACFMHNKIYKGKLCKWFENALLPLNPKLEATLKGKVANTKPCGICGTHFKLAGRKQYCSEECAEKARKQADKLRAKKYRQNKG